MNGFQPLDADTMTTTFGALFAMMPASTETIIVLVVITMGLTTVLRRRVEWLQDWKIIPVPVVIGFFLGAIFPVVESMADNLRFGLQIGVIALAVYQLGPAQIGRMGGKLKPLIEELTTRVKNGNGNNNEGTDTP
jgi:hydrogenase/urease accessory protein HupE